METLPKFGQMECLRWSDPWQSEMSLSGTNVDNLATMKQNDSLLEDFLEFSEPFDRDTVSPSPRKIQACVCYLFHCTRASKGTADEKKKDQQSVVVCFLDNQSFCVAVYPCEHQHQQQRKHYFLQHKSFHNNRTKTTNNVNV